MLKWYRRSLAIALLWSMQQTLAAPPDYIIEAPLGQWTKIGTNEAESVAFSGWGSGKYPAAGSNFAQLFGVWTGAAYDPVIPALYFTGGGHASYDGNEFYAFRLDLNAWQRVNDPSPYVESDNVNGIYPDGLPQSIHTYGGIECDWETGIIYRLTNGGSQITSTWAFDPNLAPGPMAYPSQTIAAWTDIATAPVGSGYGGGFAWDPVTKKFYGGHIGGGWLIPRFMDPRARTSGDLANPFGKQGFAPGMYFGITIDPDRRLMYVVGGNNAQTGGYVGPGLVTYNIDTQAWVNLAPGTSGDKLPETSAQGGLTYDSRRGLLWWWHGEPETRSLYQFDHRTQRWTRITPAGASPAAPYTNGTYNKFRYIERYDVLIAVGEGTSGGPEVWMYKPSDWQASGEPLPNDRTRPKSPTNLRVN